MQQETRLKIRGLNTSANDLQTGSEGQLLEAKNVDILARDVAQPRRGFTAIEASFSVSDRIDQLMSYSDTLYAHHGSTLYSATTLSYLTSGTQEVSTITCPSGGSASQGDYFLFTNADNVTYAIWLDIDGNGTTPTGSNYTTADNKIEVDITSSDAASEVAQAVYTAIEPVLLWVSTVNNSDGTLTLTQQKTGNPTDPTPYSEDDGGSGSFSVSVGTSGVAASWTSLGSFSAPSGTRIRNVRSKQNLYFTTDSGVYVMDSSTATPRRSGIPKGIAPSGDHATPTGGTNWLANGKTVAYRIVYGLRDSNDNLLLGSPSDRVLIGNDSGSNSDVELTVPTPSELTTNHFIQVYRSSIENTGTEPSDEMFLVHEENVTTPGSDQTINDVTPDDLTGATLYTSPSQQGIALANERPPVAKDIAVFNDTTFFANTTHAHTYSLNLVSTVSGYGLENNDTITIGSETYTAKTSPSASTDFQLSTGGTPSTDIEDTARALVAVINSQSSSYYAYYTSGLDDKPGAILISERTIGGSSFAITSSVAEAWSPELPSSGTDESSTNERRKNGLSWSKIQQPEHVPAAYFSLVGSADKEILRIAALRDSLYIFKEDGIFRLTGSDPSSFTIKKFDDSATLIAPDSLAILNNQIWFLSTQGVATATETDVQIRSIQIEDQFREYFGSSSYLNQVTQQAFGVAYESERKYHLWLPSSTGDTQPTFCFVFNTFTATWTKYTINATCGLVHDSKLYLGSSTNRVLEESKTFTFRDFGDFLLESSITNISDTTLTLSSGVDQISVGDQIIQGSEFFSTVTEINTVDSTVTVEVDPGFQAGVVEVLSAYECNISWPPITSNPGTHAQYHTVNCHFKESPSKDGYLDFSSELDAATTSVTLAGRGIGSWGSSPWGEFAWGGEPSQLAQRQLVPRTAARCNELSVGFRILQTYSNWKLQGVSVFFNNGTEKINR